MRHVPQHADRSVAVCVTGQATRLLQLPLPRHLVTPNPEFFFQIIYVLARSAVKHISKRVTRRQAHHSKARASKACAIS